MNNKKIVFCFHTRDHEFNFGLGFLSSALKQAGVATDLVTYRETGRHTDSPESVVQQIMRKDPAVVAFSAMTFNWQRIIDVISLLREEFHGLIVVGGYHAVLSPEEVLSHPGVDAVCPGEGEMPIVELMKYPDLRRQRTFPAIPGLIFKGQDIPPHSQKSRWFIEALDNYPYMDYDIFDSDGDLKEKHIGALAPAGIFSLPVITGRGCPYRCTYCNNSTMIELYGGVNRFVRKYNADVAVWNVKTLLNKHRPQFFEFFDETFVLNRAWIKEFCVRYSKEVATPFIVMSRIELLDESTLSLLAESGLKLLFFGLECGDEEYRMKYLKRMMTNRTIREGTRLLKRYGILIGTFNILGMPFETKDMINQTFALNEEIDPDVAVPSVYQPLPGTELAELAFEHNMVSSLSKDQWDFCSPALDTDDLPATYVLDMLEKFREKFTYRKMEDMYAKLREVAGPRG